MLLTGALYAAPLVLGYVLYQQLASQSQFKHCFAVHGMYSVTDTLCSSGPTVPSVGLKDSRALRYPASCCAMLVGWVHGQRCLLHPVML